MDGASGRLRGLWAQRLRGVGDARAGAPGAREAAGLDVDRPDVLRPAAAGAPPEHSAQYAADALEARLAQIGLDISISDLGIEREEIPTLVDDALRYMGGAVAKTPADLTREDLISLLEDSFDAE